MDKVEIQWLGSPEARILSIRKFRKYLDTLEFQNAIGACKENWENSPLIKKPQFELSNVVEWPNPWDLFSQQIFCDNSRALGMFYTLMLSKHSETHDIKFGILQDIIQGEKGIVLLDGYEEILKNKFNDWMTIQLVTKDEIKDKLGE